MTAPGTPSECHRFLGPVVPGCYPGLDCRHTFSVQGRRHTLDNGVDTRLGRRTMGSLIDVRQLWNCATGSAEIADLRRDGAKQMMRRSSTVSCEVLPSISFGPTWMTSFVSDSRRCRASEGSRGRPVTGGVLMPNSRLEFGRTRIRHAEVATRAHFDRRQWGRV